MTWDAVEAAAAKALSFDWDGCHKIYLNMDEVSQSADTQSFKGKSLDKRMALIREAYDFSCSLRFISGVRNNGKDNADFTPLIRQFDDDEQPGG